MNEERPNNMNDRKETDCPRQFELVQAISGVARPGKTEAILRHIDSCPRCDGIVKLLKHNQHEFISLHPANIVSTQLIARARKHERSSRIAFWLAPAG
ncbi:MAG: hypothetical protein JRJ19_08255, partial [Deltaproteobacteria bacterium]|nr:hypothetical protein [Deltaproteobacteria bacterium]